MKLSGIVKIDTQHAMLFITISNARALVEDNQFIALLTLLGKLESYIYMHFQDEEQFMRDNTIPGYDAHVAQHRKFKETIGNYMEELRQTGEPSIEILDFAEDWLINHINVETELFHKYVK